MRSNSTSLLFTLLVMACSPKKETRSITAVPLPIAGTWKLISGTLIEKNDTTKTDYTGNTAFIKLVNDTHFSFLQHDISKGKSSTPVFAAGGGTYTLNDSLYTEHLDYCSDRQWEGNTFKFTVTIKNDTLIQRGLEKVESAGIDRLNIETYVRLKK